MLASGALGLLVVYTGLHSKEGIGVVQLPVAAVLLSLSAAFVLDDPAAQTTAGTPTPILLPRGVRIALTLPPLIAMWAVIVAYSGLAQIDGAMWMEFAGMLALTMALAAIGARVVGYERAGMFASPTLMFLLVASRFVSDRWRPFPLDPISSTWFDAYGRWLIALAASLIVFLVVSREPARANPARRLFVRALGRTTGVSAPERHPKPEGVSR